MSKCYRKIFFRAVFSAWRLEPVYRILNKLAPVPFLFVVCADAPVMPCMASI